MKKIELNEIVTPVSHKRLEITFGNDALSNFTSVAYGICTPINSVIHRHKDTLKYAIAGVGWVALRWSGEVLTSQLKSVNKSVVLRGLQV